jgi:O-antigen ligase
MLTQRLAERPYRLLIAAGVGLVLGLAAYFVSPVWVLAALVAGVAGVAALRRPEIAVLGILVTTSSIVFEERLPLLPIGVGSLHIPDVLLLGMLVLIVVRLLVEPDFRFVRTPLDAPLLLFYGVALLSTAWATFRSPGEFSVRLRAVRVITYYLLFFAVTNLLRRRRQLRLLVGGMFALGVLVAGVMMAQFVLGDAVQILPGRVETLSTQGVQYGGITRILPPGQSVLMVSFTLTTVLIVLKDFAWCRLSTCGRWAVLAGGVLLTFNRHSWAEAGLVLGMLALLVRGPAQRRFWAMAATLLVCVGVILLVVFALPGQRGDQLTQAVLTRLSTLLQPETFEERSLEFRYLENQYALRRIGERPLLGLGLGAAYRPLDPHLDWEGFDGRRYIHNGHLWLILKTGLLGYLSFLGLSVLFIWRGLRNWRHVPDDWGRGVSLGLTLSYVGLLVGSLFSPMVMEWFWTPVIALMMGISEVIWRGFPDDDGV